MIDTTDKQTIDLFQPTKRGRGRPVTGNAATAAERARKYRENKKALKALMPQITSRETVTVNHKDMAHDAMANRIARLEGENLSLSMGFGDMKAEIDRLVLELERSQAETAKWCDIVDQRDRDYKRDLDFVLVDKNRKIAAQKAQATKFKNEAEDLRHRLADTQRQLSQEFAKQLIA